jgi:hypothetical protein
MSMRGMRVASRRQATRCACTLRRGDREPSRIGRRNMRNVDGPGLDLRSDTKAPSLFNRHEIHGGHLDERSHFS